MTRASASAWWAAARLAALLAVLVAFGVWWQRQKAPDFRVDQRLRPAPVVLAPLAAVPALVLGGETRDAVAIPAGHALRFRFTVPADGTVLRLRDSHLAAHPELVVRLLAEDGTATEIERHETTLMRWESRRVELPAPAGATVTLELAAQDGRGMPGLGAVHVADIVLESEGRGVDETDVPMRTRAQVADLLARRGEARVRSPPTTDSARIAHDGPAALPLTVREPFFTTADALPQDSRLDIVLHVGRPFPDGPAGEGRVVLAADGQPLAALPVALATDQVAADLHFSVELSAWAGKSVDLGLQLQGAENLFVGLAELLVSAPVTVRRRPYQPGLGRNVLLISVNALRPERLGCYGYAPARTPAIDALAARGGRYTRLLAPSSWTLPNLATLLTGQSPVSHGLGMAEGRRLSPRLVTLQQSAAWSGLTTAMFSSSPWVSAQTGLDQGWETFVLDGLPAPVLAEQAIDWLQQASQFQWFLALHFADPAYPYAPPLEDLARIGAPPAPELVESLRHIDSRPGAAEAVAAEIGTLYDAEVAAVDRAIGMLVAELDRLGALQDTLVVVVGTEGEEFYEHNGRLFGQTLFDEVVRVPLVLAGPGVRGVDGGAFVETEPIELVDVTRLLGRFGNLSSLSTLQGRLPPPFSPRLPDPVAHAVLVPFAGITTRHLDASRSRRWLRVVDRASGRESLFDLEADPQALHDVLVEPDDETRFHAASLAAAFDDWWRACLQTAGTQPVSRATAPP